MENYLEKNDESQKLMKKVKQKIISFFFINIIAITLFIVFQSNVLFLFRLNRDLDTISAYGSYQLISIILVIIVLLYFISYGLLTHGYFLKEKDKINDEKFQKRYNFFDFFSIIPLFFLVMMTINGLFFTIAVIDGASMEPNYHDEDIVIISYMKSIDRDSVIVFEDEKLLIKRVIGIPGDTLRVENNQVWLNGVYIEDTQYQFVYDGVIPADKYFVLGDNRSNSRDSRDIGLIDKDNIVGVAVLDLS